MMKKAQTLLKSGFFGKLRKSPEQNLNCFILCKHPSLTLQRLSPSSR